MPTSATVMHPTPPSSQSAVSNQRNADLISSPLNFAHLPAPILPSSNQQLNAGSAQQPQSQNGTQQQNELNNQANGSVSQLPNQIPNTIVMHTNAAPSQ
ncbi:unnamed protein product, partial [Anisakis simplex]|uniref:Uncharacterized protein n=1 Tax=Anisakis simplex TaxID=6269 RepID=A0A0M3JKH3_ANISI